jgi:uncharacterized repeat protein (TIGR01451 family)
MKRFFHGRLLGLLLLALTCTGGRAGAAGFALTASDSTNLFFIATPLKTYLTVTNETGLVLTNTYVTNTFSGLVAITGFTNDYTTNYSDYTNGNTFIIAVPEFTNGSVIHMAFSWQPLTTAPLTNAIVVASSDVTNTAATNLIYRVYSVQADLGVAVDLVSPVAFTNDWVITNDSVTYAVTLTNQGPGAVPGLLLTNTLPAGVVLRGVTPAGSTFATVSNTLIFTLPTLAAKAAIGFQVAIQPTNAGAMPLIAGMNAEGLYDPGLTGETNNELFVTNYLPAALVAVTSSAQTVNPQNGLIEQTILVSNVGDFTAPGVRVVVTGLTNQLFNASGTNYGFNPASDNPGSPFVVAPAPLAPGTSVSLRLQYAPRLPFAFTNRQLQAYAVPAPVLEYTPPAATRGGTNLNFSRILQLPDGDMLLEFPTSLTNSYTVVYSDNTAFSNAMIALPVIVPAANRTQWLDYGPPATVSAPTNSSLRFYRVLLNP